MWFRKLMGFSEESPEQVRSLIALDGAMMYSRVNGRAVGCGRLETPTLESLRQRAMAAACKPGPLRVTELVDDVQRLHEDEDGAGALFQVASQFNLLEMVGPTITPEQGVEIYEYDATQGPACAIAAGAGVIFRNYFARVGVDGALADEADHNAQVGQDSQRQLDGSAGLGAFFDNHDHRLWRMENGYFLPTAAGLEEINQRLAASTDEELDAIRAAIRIGLHWNVEVTSSAARHCVSQAYCSAMPVAYSDLPFELWEPLARLTLEAAYEATLWAGLLPERIGPNRAVSLTLLGGGAFGNAAAWIIDAMDRALNLVQERGCALDVAIVSFRESRPEVAALVERYA